MGTNEEQPLLLRIITSPKTKDYFDLHHLPLATAVASLKTSDLLIQLQILDEYRRTCNNLYERVRCLLFLYAVHRYYLPLRRNRRKNGAANKIPREGKEYILCPRGYAALLDRRFGEAIDHFLAFVQEDPDSIDDFDDEEIVMPKKTRLTSDLTFDPSRKMATIRMNGAGLEKKTSRYSSFSSESVQQQQQQQQETKKLLHSKLLLPSEAASSSLATTYRSLAFQTLADQVKSSVRTHPGNEWMFAVKDVEGQVLRFSDDLTSGEGLFLLEKTPVRMDLSHSCWSDIFFLGMDFPEGARVINCSVDLSVVQFQEGKSTNTQPVPPIECRLFLSTDNPGTIKLTSVDLHSSVVLTHVSQVFNYAADYLGLLKAGLVSAGIIPLGLEKVCQEQDIPIKDLLIEMLGTDTCQYGLELVTNVNGIPKGSRLAVSTNLLGSIIAVCMRATKQTKSLTGPLLEEERRLVAARAILGEWLGGSGGGWQDSGGIWPGIKLIHGVVSAMGDPEYGISSGRLLPNHKLLSQEEAPSELLHALEKSLVLVHGGMAQNVGPILEMVTEKFLLREEEEWVARHDAIDILDKLLVAFRNVDIKTIAALVTENFFGPIRSVIPWATNAYTERLIDEAQRRFGDKFWGFWMLASFYGGASGGGMGFIFDPDIKQEASSVLGEIMCNAKHQMESYLPFAMDPVVFEYKVNKAGTVAELCSGINQTNGDDNKSTSSNGSDKTTANEDLNTLLKEQGFDPTTQEHIRLQLRDGNIGLANNRLPMDCKLSDVSAEDVLSFVENDSLPSSTRVRGIEALRSGSVGVVTLAAGVGSRWTGGAGVVKALNPFCSIGGRHRNFLDVHLAKNRRVSSDVGMSIPHVVTTSWMTHEPIATYISTLYNDSIYVSKGASIGLRMVPMIRDLKFLFEEQTKQKLDEQAQKVQDSIHAALIGWAEANGEGSYYTFNLPKQCVCPVGHWYEVPNLLLNGTLAKMLSDRPQLKTLMLHNIDTIGANVDATVLGAFLSSGSTLAYEVVPRCIEDMGGGLCRVNGKPRLVEGLALPREEDELKSSYYNSLTTWIDIDGLLSQFGLNRNDILEGSEKIHDAVNEFSKQLPTYVTIKDVKMRWGNGQEDLHPVCQFEKLWGDMSSIDGIKCSYFVVPRQRGQQLKDPASLDGWSRDGGAEYLDSICCWT